MLLQPTEEYGTACNAPNFDVWINKCDYLTAWELLQYFYDETLQVLCYKILFYLLILILYYIILYYYRNSQCPFLILFIKNKTGFRHLMLRYVFIGAAIPTLVIRMQLNIIIEYLTITKKRCQKLACMLIMLYCVQHIHIAQIMKLKTTVLMILHV